MDTLCMHLVRQIYMFADTSCICQEDEMLRRLVAQHGTKKWAHLATIIKSKKSKQVIRTETV